METHPDSNVDILRQLTEAELLNLIELYKSKGDRYHNMTIYNDYRWSRLLREGGVNGKWLLNKTYYTHRLGNLATNGTFVSVHNDKILSIQFHTFEESLQELKECIIATKLIDWKNGPLLTAIHADIADEILELIRTQGGTVDYEIPCICFTITQDIALKQHVQSVPEGYEMRPLEQKHAHFIHANWPHNEESSVDLIEAMIEFNITLGVFRLADDELIAWIFQNEFYGIGILQVITEEQGRGFGKLLTHALSKEIALVDENDITSFTIVDNVKPISILKKMGYVKNCSTKWVWFKKL